MNSSRGGMPAESVVSLHSQPSETDSSSTESKLAVSAAETAEAVRGTHMERRQVRKSVLTLTDSGYCLRSIDAAAESLLIKFDGSIETIDESGNQLNQQPGDANDEDETQSIVVHAVAGIFELNLHKYALVITDSRSRGMLGGSDVFEVTGVGALPLDYDSGSDALQKLLHNTRAKAAPSEVEAASHASTSLLNGDTADTPSDATGSGNSTTNTPHERKESSSSVLPVSDASLSWLSPQITKLLGRNSKKPESKLGSASISTTDSGGPGKPNDPAPDGNADAAGDGTRLELVDSTPDVAADAKGTRTGSSVQRMEMRIVDEIIRVFASSGMFYSYRYDLTRSLQEKNGQTAVSDDVMLSQVANTDYWFNHHMQLPLLSGHTEQWAVPLIQGCVQIAVCDVQDGDSFRVCVLSRRNCRRIGMRYERRGANADGYVANFVETEQILALVSGVEQETHYASFLQTRGSIPFYWRQPSSGLHPVPVVLKDDEENAAVCARHLQREIDRHGRQVLVNLVEHKGREAVVGSKYAGLVGHCVAGEMIDARYVRYIPWDFHYETRGMRFETLNQLADQLQREISDMGYFWQAGAHRFTTQTGIFRVNCMDCLDRTNVVQSTIARCVLNEQLVRLGVHISPEQGLRAYPGLESTLNHLWANNGDYISRQYAGTSAMKGDFTRTGKRKFTGLMNDASYSLARLWINTFRDYFSQSVLDFVMGSQKAVDVFRTLVDLKSREPDRAIELTRTRESAIESSIAIVVHDGERVQIALVVNSPMALNTKRIRRSEDAVLILTDAAVYVCQYHYQMEKVSEFIRIEVSQLIRVQHGAYITDTLVPQSLDTEHNHGLVLYFASAVARFNSGNPHNKSEIGDEHLRAEASGRDAHADQEPALRDPDSAADPDSATVQQQSSEVESLPATADPAPTENYIACKLADEAQVVMQLMPGQEPAAVGPSSNNGTAALSLARLESLEGQSPCLLAECLCSVIQSAKASSIAPGGSPFVVEEPIIGAAEAKRNVSVIDKMSSTLHKALWI